MKPWTKVYGTLKKLIEYELGVEIPGVPKLFAASKPRDSFNTLLNITKEKSDDFIKIIDELEDLHSLNRGTPEKTHVVPGARRGRQIQVQGADPPIRGGDEHYHNRGRP